MKRLAFMLAMWGLFLGDCLPLKAQVSLPLSSLVITSEFGQRKHPVTGKNHFHSGTDLRAHYQPVLSVLDGRIMSFGEDRIMGKYIKVNHGTLESIYGHLSKILITSGDQVHSGQVLAISGNSGRSTGAHLHFSMKSSGKFINPLAALKILKTKINNNFMDNKPPIENAELPLAALLMLLSDNERISLHPRQAQEYRTSVADQLPQTEEKEVDDGK